jgi:hypothetical protein
LTDFVTFRVFGGSAKALPQASAATTKASVFFTVEIPLVD